MPATSCATGSPNSARWTIDNVKRPGGDDRFSAAAAAMGYRTHGLAWLNRNRRLAKDFEASIASATTWIYIASGGSPEYSHYDSASDTKRSSMLVTGMMRIAVPACSAGIGCFPAYGATIRAEGHREHASGQADVFDEPRSRVSSWPPQRPTRLR
jgi:hypothetical protein